MKVCFKIDTGLPEILKKKRNTNRYVKGREREYRKKEEREGKEKNAQN